MQTVEINSLTEPTETTVVDENYQPTRHPKIDTSLATSFIEEDEEWWARMLTADGDDQC